MLTELFIAQIFGLFSFVLGAACFLQKNDQRFKYIMLALNTNHAIHFFLMGAMTSVICSIVSAMRTLTSIKTKSRYVAYFFIALTVGVSSLWAQHWYDWMCVIGACFGTYGLFCMSGIKMRFTLMAGSICWLVNNFLVGSIGGVMLETMVLAINTSTIIRLYRDQLAAQIPSTNA